MKTTVALMCSILLAVQCSYADESDAGVQEKPAGGDKGALTVRKLQGKVSWKGAAGKAAPYGYGSLAIAVSVPTTITDLNTLALTQEGFVDTQYHGLRASETWMTKASSTARTYVYAGTDSSGVKYKYTVKMTEKRCAQHYGQRSQPHVCGQVVQSE